MSGMKYSGIKSIGKIPYNWKIKKCKYITEFINGYAFDSDLMQSSGKYPIVRIGDIDGERISFDNCLYVDSNAGLDKYKIKKDDLLLAMSGATVGKTGYSQDDFEAYINQRVGIIRSLNNKFINYFLKTDYFHEYVNLMSVGSAQPNISSTSFGEFKISVPNTREQKLIVDFLDEKIDIIDKIIGDLNNQIEILNKYKKQIITETVTSGLNKNAKFKDSGIDWMGEIPEHWEIKRLKYLGSARNGLTYEPEDQCDEGMLVLRSSNIQDGKLCLDDNVYVNMKVPKNIILKRNDLLICSRNGSRNLIGKNVLIEDSIEGNTYGAFMCVFRSEYNKYIHYVLNSNIFDHYLNTFLTSTINQLTNSNLYSIKIAIPMDIEEQQEIVKYLDDRCQKIDEILNSKIKQKEQMEQYKKSVIYEYVTGKKRVEGAEELYG